jgi:hypothetical protein
VRPILPRTQVLRLITVVLCGSACASTLSQAGPESACQPAAPESVAPHVDYLRTLISAGDSESVAGRKAFELPWAPAREVRWVTTPSLCAAAVVALNAVAGTPGRSRRVWVYQIGQAYAVEDSSLQWAEGRGSEPYRCTCATASGGPSRCS